MFQSRKKLTGGIFPNGKKISRLLSAKQPADLRACLKKHFRNLQAPLCGIFYPHSVAVARYAVLIRIKSPTNWGLAAYEKPFSDTL